MGFGFGVGVTFAVAREFHVVDDDVKGVELGSVFLVAARLDSPFDEHAGAFAHVLVHEFGGFVPNNEVEEVNGVFVLGEGALDCDSDSRVGFAALGLYELDVAGQIPAEKYFVHEGCLLK